MTTSQATAKRGPEHGLERLIFFSDAVFAIAITLLVIDLHVPHLPPHASDTDYWLALVGLAPQFVGFFISFFVIGSFWAGHHRTMMLASHYSPTLVMPNLMILSTIAAMPFFTAFVSASPMARVPAFCYAAWLLLTAILNRRLQAIVTRPPVLDERAPADQIATTRIRGTSVILGTATAVVVSLVVPVLGQVTLMTIPLWRMLLARRHRAKSVVVKPTDTDHAAA